MRHLLILLMVALCVLTWSTLAAQDTLPKQKDIIDVLFPKKRAAKETSGETDTLEKGKLYLAPLPIIGYAPANGIVVGAGISGSKLVGNSKTTHVSSGLLNATVTSKEQVNINLRTNIYLPDDKWILMGDWRLLLFAQPTYGLGVNFKDPSSFNIGGLEIEKSPNEQPMRFDYVRLYETAYRRIFKSFYAGIGINVDYHYHVKDEDLDTSLPDLKLTSHFLYSTQKGFDLERYAVTGISLNLLYDSRDNAVNAQKGHYAQLTVKANPAIFNISQASSIIYYEYRTYIPLSRLKYRKKTLAFWTWGQLLFGGKMPYLALPSITWDMYNRSGRGYIQGRIRGENFWYGETEYRFPITRSGLLGGVAFVNVTTASNLSLNQPLFYAVAPGYGGGLRIKFSRKTNTNICVDYGRGLNGSNGIYFNLQEAF